MYRRVAAAWTMSECRGLRRWTAASQCRVSVESFRSTTRPSGRRSCRKFSRCLSIAVTWFHPSSPTTAFPSSSRPTSGIPSGRGRCCPPPRTAQSTCGTGSTNQLPAADQEPFCCVDEDVNDLNVV